MSWKKMASGDPERDIVGADVGYYRMASGEPMREIIGDVIGHEEVIGALFGGPIGRWFRRRIARPISREVKTLTRPIGRIPGVNEAVSAVRSYGDVMLTPERIAAGALTGLIAKGPKGFVQGAKNQALVTYRESRRFVQNPVVRYGTKGAALLFPQLTPVAAGVEAANQAIAAVEHKDPLKAAFALATIANTADLAKAGDEDAMRAIKTIKAVRDGDIPDVARKAKDIMGLKFSLPKGITKNKAVSSANTLLNKAKSGNAIAQSIVRQTIAAAKLPNAPKNLLAGAKVLAVVHAAQSQLPKAPSVRALGRMVGSYRKAVRPAKGKAYAGSYLVDATGKVYKGTFQAK